MSDPRRTLTESEKRARTIPATVTDPEQRQRLLQEATSRISATVAIDWDECDCCNCARDNELDS